MNLRAVVIARLAPGVPSVPGALLYVNPEGFLTTHPTGAAFLGVHAQPGLVPEVAGCVPVLVHAIGQTLCRAGSEAPAIKIERETTPAAVEPKQSPAAKQQNLPPIPPGEIRYLDGPDIELW